MELTMFLHVTRVRHLGDYRLELEFSNDVTKQVDLSGQLYGEIFEPLRDLTYFQKVAVSEETKTIEWPNGADFAPEFLYVNGEAAAVN